MRYARWIAAIAAVWLAAPSAFANDRPRLVLAHDERDSSAPNVVSLSLINDTGHDVFIYGYNSALITPEGRTTSHWFVVEDVFGNPLHYKGRFVKSAPPAPSEFTRVPSGSTIRSKVDLSQEYDVPAASLIRVSTSVAVYDQLPALLNSGESESVPYESIKSNAVSFTVRSVPERPELRASSVIQCTPSQQAQTRQAVAAAQSISEEAINFLGGLYYVDPIDPANPQIPRVHMKPHPRYQNWFGTWDDNAPQAPDPASIGTDNARVDQVLMATYVRLLSGASTVCDECKGYHPAARAWLEGKLIHLCPVNFSDPVWGGITSQAGTIAHEVSHQDDGNAKGTVDVHGVSNRATAHALQRPLAVTSAANYEYFITNAPLGRSGE